MTIFVDYNDFFRIITVLITDDITDRPCGLELGLFFLRRSCYSVSCQICCKTIFHREQ